MSKSFTDKITDKFLSYVPDGRIKVEAANRSDSKKGKSISGDIKKEATLFSAKTMKDWKDAIALATDAENPSFLFLDDLYKHLLLDAHVVSVIESRIFRVLRSDYIFVNESGDEVPEVKNMLEAPWFEEWLKQVLLSKFTGIKVLENIHLNENLELVKTTSIPMAHINPKKGIILKEAGDENGWDYRSGSRSNFYMQIGEDTDIGILADLAPLILAKKLAMGAWLDYADKYGIPSKSITTDNLTPQRSDELLEMGLEMINNHVAVLQGNEKIEIHETTKADAYNVFNEMVKRINSEISKRILGQDGTTDNKDASGTYGSIKVLQEVANDRHESDKLFAKYIINTELIPRLVTISSFYAPLAALKFDWDTSEEIEKGIMIDKAVALTQAGFELDYEILAEKTGMPIKGFVKPTNPQATEDPKKKSQK